MTSLQEQNLEQEIKEAPIRRNPLDPLSEQKPFLTFLLIIYKHIEHLPPMITYFLNFISIALLASGILAEKNSSDIVYNFSSEPDFQGPFLFFVLGHNIFILTFFGICLIWKNTLLTRSQASSKTRFKLVFFFFGLLLRIFYFTIFPFQVLITLLFVRCKNLKNTDLCGTNEHKIKMGIFIGNLVVSALYVIICQSTLTGIHNNRDPMSSTVIPKLEVFQITLIFTEIIKHVFTWSANEQLLRRRLTYAFSFLITFGYALYYKSADGRFNKLAGRIHYQGVGLVSWISFRQFAWSLIKSNFFEINPKFENLILILEISVCLKITYSLFETFSKNYKSKSDRSVFDEMMRIKEMILVTENLISIKLSRGEEEICEELVRLKGMYKNHQIYCNDKTCSCQKKTDFKFGGNNLHRFRDFYLKEFIRLIDRYPKNFTIRFYYVYYILKFNRNLKILTIQLHHLKSLIGISKLDMLRYLQIEIMVESTFNEVYKGKKKIDGLKISSIGQADLESISTDDAMRILIQQKSNHGYLKFYEFITIDRLFNEMLDRMRDSIDVHQIFLDRLQKKHTNLKTIHNLVQLLANLHKKVDKVFLELKEKAFKFTTFYLLPYGFFKNQTQNGIRECNLILREFKQKVKTSSKIFARIHKSIQNLNLELNSVCFLFSMSKESFMDIVYVTRSYERVFEADISFQNANLMDILPPTTSELHQEIVKEYLENLKRSYLSQEKIGLLCLKEYLYDKVSYIANLFPSILLEPMIVLYAKKHPLRQNKYMFVLSNSGVIEGCSRNMKELFPDVMGLMGKKIYSVCKDMKNDIKNFRYYALAVKKASEIGSSLLYPGFRKTKIKHYKDEWSKMDYKTSKGKTAIFKLSRNLQLEVKFKLKIDYYHFGERNSHSIWLSFKVENELKNNGSVKAGPKKNLLRFHARKGLARVTYINKLKLFRKDDEASKEICMMLGGENVDDKTKKEIKTKRAFRDRKRKTKIMGEADAKRIHMQHKNKKRIQRPSFFNNTGNSSTLDKLRKKHQEEHPEKMEEVDELEEVINAKNDQRGAQTERAPFGEKITISKKHSSKSKYSGFQSNRSYRKIGNSREQNKSNNHSKILNSDNKLSLFNKVKKSENSEALAIKENLGRRSEESGSLKSTSKFSKIFSATTNPSFFRMSKFNFIILIIQIINISLAFIALIIVRFYYTQKNIDYLRENRSSELFSYLTNSIKTGYDDILKLSLIQEGILKNSRFKIFSESVNSEELTWFNEMDLEDAKRFYKNDLNRRLMFTRIYTKELHELVSSGIREESLKLIYNTPVTVYYWDHFQEDIKDVKTGEMNTFNMISYILINMREMFAKDDFSKDSVMFQALDYNVPNGMKHLLIKFKELFGDVEVEKFKTDKDFAVSIILYCSGIITLLTFLTIPAFYKIRKLIVSIYRSLEDLYDFELRYKMSMLDELEDALDVCQENMKVVEGLIQIRTK